jgi:uncharacterized protein
VKPLDSSAAEIEALQTLCERLAGFDPGISLEWLDGCMAALIAGPRIVLPDEWLPKLLGDAWERTFADPPDVEQAMSTLMQRWNVLASQLHPEPLFDEPDRLRLAPLIAFDDDESPDARSPGEGVPAGDDSDDTPREGELWAIGFLETVAAFADDWRAPDPADDDVEVYAGCLGTVEALTLRDPALLDTALRKLFPGQTLDRDDLIDEACFAVQDLRCLWLERATRTAPRRVDKAPGRNDPCPCGSGRKFKKCHGAPGATP